MAHKRELPNSEILTIMFTGIAGSTAMAGVLRSERDNDDFDTGKARKLHDEIIRKCLDENLGYEVKNKGGGFIAVFEWPQDAIVTAACIIKRFESLKIPNPADPDNYLQVRIALHTGTVYPVTDSSHKIVDYEGHDVLLAARIQAIAAKSQILLSGDTKEMSGRFSDYDYYPLRKMQFKGIEYLVEIYELLWGDRQPGPEPPNDRTIKYPSIFNKSVIGRDEFIRDLKDNIKMHKLLTICGIGGVGKTAAAIKTCKEIDDKYDIFIVAMDGFDGEASEGQMIDQIAASMELPTASLKGLDSLKTAIENICVKTPVLLLIDNYEIVNPSDRGNDRRTNDRRTDARKEAERRREDRRGRELRRVIAVLTEVPCLKILITSIVSAGIDCEKVVRLHPLDLNFGERKDDELIRFLEASSSYRLLQQRVRLLAGKGNWQVSGVDAEHVKGILEITNGIPLAIELVAGRMGTCSWQEAAASLKKSAELSMVRGSRGERPPRSDRHLSIDVCLNWSYEKLSEPAQRLFRALSLFANGFETPLVRECYEKLFINNSIQALLEEIETSSLINLMDDGKWRFLSIVHRYGKDVLNEDKNKSEKKYVIEPAFISYWDNFVKRYSDTGIKYGNNFNLLEKEHGHIIEFLNLLLANDNYHAKFILYTNTISEYWGIKKMWGCSIGYLKNAIEIARNKAANNPDEYQPYVAMTCISLASLLKNVGNGKGAMNLYAEALQICRTLSKKYPDAYLPEVATTCVSLAVMLKNMGDMQGAEKLYAEALQIYRTFAKKQPGEYLPKAALTGNNLALLLKNMGDDKAAKKLYEEALRIYITLSEKHPGDYLPKVAMTSSNLAIVLHKTGDYKGAKKLYEETLRIYRTLSQEQPDVYLPKVAMASNNLAIVLHKMEVIKRR
ncbi:MAG: tetratricopeptide repeat protein [Nitrospirae bacterium]|nr:tetratricopeptide repeat protein [Nitrospirota bacterium]